MRKGSPSGAMPRHVVGSRSTSATSAGFRGGASSPSRLEGIEGLRALAVGSILVYHVWLYSQPGGQLADFGPLTRYVFPRLPLGVTLFFTLSAFLLYRPIVTALVEGRPRPRLGPYLRNRALRILPAYWVVLIITAVVLPAAALRVSSDTIAIGRMANDPGLLLRNAALAQNYVPGSMLTGISPAWSLAVEVVFYLALPLLGLFATGCAVLSTHPRGRLMAATVPAAGMLLIGLSGKAVAASWLVSSGTPNPGWDGDWHSVVVRSFWGQADLFSFGMILAVVYVGLERGHLSLPRWWRWPTAACALLAAVSLAVLADRRVWSPGRNPYELAGALGCALLLALVVLPPGGRTRARPLVGILTTRIVVAAGLISYSIFLWQEPLVRLLRSQGWTFTGRLGFVIDLAMVVSLTAVASAATYRWVERPALRRKDRPHVHSTDGA